MSDLLTDEQITTALSGRPGWSRYGDEITRTVTAPTFAAGIRLVDAVAARADQANHHPDIDIRWTAVTFRLSTHSAGGLTRRDLDLAGVIDDLAADLR
jgi:4a-hydroxytetrahydrobiopterin dehydratase